MAAFKGAVDAARRGIKRGGGGGGGDRARGEVEKGIPVAVLPLAQPVETRAVLDRVALRHRLLTEHCETKNRKWSKDINARSDGGAKNLDEAVHSIHTVPAATTADVVVQTVLVGIRSCTAWRGADEFAIRPIFVLRPSSCPLAACVRLVRELLCRSNKDMTNEA